jgi:hypothetical protein
MTAYRYEIKFPEPAVEEGKEAPPKQEDFFIVVIAPNGDTARTALKQQFPLEGMSILYQSQTEHILHAQ